MNRRTFTLPATCMAAGLAVFGALAPCAGHAAEKAWWWDDTWWAEGRLPSTTSHPVTVRETAYENGDTEVPALIFRPAGTGKHPAVLFLHGRRGLDSTVRGHAKRLAARGFVVLVPDLYMARMIPAMPIRHDYDTEKDAAAGLDHLLRLPDVDGASACLYGISRGGYYSLKTAVSHGRQEKGAACFVGYYPHLQDPNAPEPEQVYGYAPEIEEFTLPTLVFIGDQEQYQRRRNIETAVDALTKKGRAARLVIYPGVGRGFDFREAHVRTFGDDLAAKDAIQRAAEFMRGILVKPSQ